MKLAPKGKMSGDITVSSSVKWGHLAHLDPNSKKHNSPYQSYGVI